ncbi:MAG TPA: C2H2-type zinc finger protein [Thermoplasmata archaeon]|nr:C2H2-type zinc finger protein [Thermoplasmata archaeon]
MAEECADCGASFASPADLVAHMKKVHAGGDPKASLGMNPESRTPGLECSICGARFATAEALAAHNLKPHPSAARNGPAVPFSI